jgi:hypothetical protein
MQDSAESTQIRDFLCEIETEFKNILGCLSGPLVPSIYEKNGARKSRDTVEGGRCEHVVMGRGFLLHCLFNMLHRKWTSVSAFDCCSPLSESTFYRMLKILNLIH